MKPIDVVGGAGVCLTIVAMFLILCFSLYSCEKLPDEYQTCIDKGNSWVAIPGTYDKKNPAEYACLAPGQEMPAKD